MLSLLLILGALIAVNANPVSEAPMSEQQLRDLAKNILNEANKLVEEANDIRQTAQPLVHQELEKGEVMQKLKKKFEEGLASQSLSADCAATVDSGYGKLIEEIADEYLQAEAFKISRNEIFTKSAAKDIAGAMESLEQPDDYVKNCLSKPESCQLTGEFMEGTENAAKVLSALKGIVPTSLPNSDFFKSESVKKNIENYVASISSCLKLE